MPYSRLLLVVISREAGLRSALAASVSLYGANPITAGHIDDPQVARLRGPAALLVDAALLTPTVLEQLSEDPRWSRIVILGEAPEGALSDRVEAIDPAGAVAELPKLLERLR